VFGDLVGKSREELRSLLVQELQVASELGLEAEDRPGSET
jgi:hypothetical protein